MLEFHQFVTEYGRAYVPETFEWIQREIIFHKNTEQIKEQNEAYNKGESTWSAALNEFADRTDDEMKKLRGYKPSPSDRNRLQSLTRSPLKVGGDLPKNVDWRNKKDIVTPPKNQGQCGSCWAHAAVETIESHAAIQLGIKAMELAPQQLVDCVQNLDQCGGTGGCEGATAEVAYNYSRVGIALNSDYHYTAQDGQCKTVHPTVYVDGYVQLPKNDPSALLRAVADYGPVAISVAANTWSFYEAGVFDGPSKGGCGFDVDHAVQLVGYGTDEASGEDYWLVRNSWGSQWGEGGYIRVKRHDNPPCGVDSTPLDGVCGKGSCACGNATTYCGTCAILSDSSYPKKLSLQPIQ